MVWMMKALCSYGLRKIQNSCRVVQNGAALASLQKLCKEEMLSEALQALIDMEQYGVPLSTHIIYCLLQKCIDKKDLVTGKELYYLIRESGFESNTFLGSHIIRMFSLSETLSEAELVFSRLQEPNVLNWTAIISAHIKHGKYEKAIKMHHQMQQANVQQDEYVFVAVLNACAGAAALSEGKMIHLQIINRCLNYNVFVGNALIDMYAKCGSLEDAERVFSGLPERDLVSWNTMIASYTQHGLNQEALNLFQLMQQVGREPGVVTFVGILKASSGILFLDQGKMIHSQIIENGSEADVIVGSALVNMYAKCGNLQDASRVFDRIQNRNVTIWNSMITGYAQNGDGKNALQLFQKMHDYVKPNEITYASILKACSNVTSLDDGKRVHAHIIDSGVELNTFTGSTLIDMYTTCGSLDDARYVFDNILKLDVVTWSAMVAGYGQHGYGQDALYLFQQMQQKGMKLDIVTYVSILKACTSITALHQGNLIYAHLIENGFESDVCVGSTLIDMYAKCGILTDANDVFNKLPKRNIITWSALIAGYALHGKYHLALQYFKDMQQQGLNPDDVIFVSLISTCGHLGLVHEGRGHFKAMIEDFGITPTLEHYNCMVDLLGRMGRLSEAADLIDILPTHSSFVGWMTLLTHCKTHGNVSLGRKCFDNILLQDCRHASAYMLMSNIYAAAEVWEGAEEIHDLRKCALAWKIPGKASVEVNNTVHLFIVEGQNHSQTINVYGKLKELNLKMVKGGHVPHLTSMSQLVPDGLRPL